MEKLFEQIVAEKEEKVVEEYIKQYRIKVHSMKSTSAMIGAFSLSGVAKMLEYAARDNRKDIIESVTLPFLEQWRSYKEQLKVCIPEEETTTEKLEVDHEKLGEFFNLLKAAMEDMDIDTADEVMSQIKSFHYPDDVFSNIEKLGIAVTNLDGEEVKACIEAVSMQIQ